MNRRVIDEKEKKRERETREHLKKSQFKISLG